MKSYILVQLADGTYKNVDTQDIIQIFKNTLGGETVIFKGNITSISQSGFAYCKSLETIELKFRYTSL